MQKQFTFAREDQPDTAWLTRFAAGREEAERWYLGKGRTPPPSSAECRVALRDHMPELLSQYDRACALVGDDDRAHQILSQYRPPPVQAAAKRSGSGTMVQPLFATTTSPSTLCLISLS